ncbi:putative pentatricopeptide repeat-containing protein At1g77010, mitochondrial [Actinidia eriantha]|uniref:putative pentatricopeptide repeat-containing protein At1g77010, mitochondrial n=1 Tax=Actinidia eriantha TaxID=165200 RepID=UPI00258F358A|nr:putative pentatricopeptide repeat-containing protein At1g77010, mitochondrial [Actinidia eriantha]XP_057469366.1 putative pentatricopeptide repeat-containing protein At1g77010, mitochondrial [Actinidia eriantha]XP_057469367.1 putative pentatricopeptide repeat-containing protein At1g77010, mitochondrial [Actinidia eriantha]XP_057469369.1 putative pentatricopeptide repeat-containing protein At1g77010, mitochondrial [Actinidia eriantha]XP_057469370.1 putative pentatricopeptide repeat-containing
MDLDIHSCARLLQSFTTHHWIQQGRQIHLLFLKRGVLSSALTIANRILQMYIRCGHLSDAHKLFDEMSERNCFTWNTMIEGYMKSGSKEKSLELFGLMPRRNCFSWNLVVSGYAKAGELEIARGLFDEMPMRNWFAWNLMIHGYARSGRSREAVKLFRELSSDPCEESRGDTFVLATVIVACTDLAALDCGKQIHARIIIDEVEFDSVLASSLINLYGKSGDMDSASHVSNLMQDPDDFSLSALISGYANCGRMEDARRCFSFKSDPCFVLWNNMIAGYTANKEANEALILFNKMRKNGIEEDFSTFASVLGACSSLGISENCKQMHAHACKFGISDDLIIASALVDTYAKCGIPSDACKLFRELKTHDTILLNSMITVYSNCGRIEDAKHIFETMPARSLISWNSMIVGLSQNGCPIEALDLFCKMNMMGLRTDKFSLASVISACASISSFELGEQVFARATVVGLEFDQVVSTSLIDLYCKSGFVENGRKLFDQTIKSDEVSWNSMLMGYATNGYGIEALNLFSEMRCKGVVPTDITFTGVLSACDHCGLIEEGRKWFHAMKNNYHIHPGIEHYSCMVDLFARAGCLEDAMSLIEEMPFEADASMWSSVLRGCVTHGNKSLAKKVAEQITDLDPENSGAYMQLSSMLATSGDWERSAQIRKMMRDMRIQKNPGCSWAEC